tara:strand:+ start:349 stop:525 length:177 start_codon:yes stop_codon:yes gene_type:complete
MKRYEVNTWWMGAKSIVVEAECEDQAKEKAYDIDVGDNYVMDSFEIGSIEEVDDDSAV